LLPLVLMMLGYSKIIYKLRNTVTKIIHFVMLCSSTKPT